MHLYLYHDTPPEMIQAPEKNGGWKSGSFLGHLFQEPNSSNGWHDWMWCFGRDLNIRFFLEGTSRPTWTFGTWWIIMKCYCSSILLAGTFECVFLIALQIYWVLPYYSIMYGPFGVFRGAAPKRLFWKGVSKHIGSPNTSKLHKVGPKTFQNQSKRYFPHKLHNISGGWTTKKKYKQTLCIFKAIL